MFTSLKRAHICGMCCRMDKMNRGFLKASDWGAKEFIHVVELFSLMYMQKYLGLPTQASTPEQVGLHFS